MEISKTYDPSQLEKKWYAFWSEKGYFTPVMDKTKKPFTVLIPPPNVTGALHMGHVLNNTLQDVIVRFHRMCGEPTLWLPGVDHAGIATQNVVEKQLATEGKNRHEIGRDELVGLIWKWKEEKGDRIIEQLKQLGCSCDWSRLRFTMDEMLSKAVKETFVSLYNDGLIYKGKYIINWCPRCVTALANDEVEHADESGKLWYFKYPYKDGEGFVTIATTRPETMLGDTAVAVNPKDERYKHLIGKELILPLTDRTIPVIADEYVDLEFGTGCVKVTPAHDPNDFEIGNRHNLERLLVMDEHGIMNENAPEQFRGMDRYACRELIIKQMQEQGLLEKIDNHELAVGHCYRCDTVIEPYLSDQWFVKMKPMAEAAIQVVESGEVKFQPERWTKVYMHWMNNIRDWCISRQIWWGHRIPAYYCASCGKMVVAKEMPSACPDCTNETFRQDEDVLDTWFSSWLWPFSTMGWPDETEDQTYFLPTNILITAPEIIYLWVARMIMSTLHFKGMIPFNTVLLHGTVRDEIGRKMSKSLGNSPDPIDIIETVGADALRFSMIFNTPKGADVNYSDAMLETGRNFANKIWNAYRFIMMNAETIKGLPNQEELQLELADKWIYSRLHETIADVSRYYSNLQFNDAAQDLLKFIWDDFCSWYLELSKDRIFSEDDDVSSNNSRMTALFTLLDVMQSAMRLLHPIMPFITEELWQGIRTHFPMPEESIMISDFPKCYPKYLRGDIGIEMEWIKDIILTLRSLRKAYNIHPSQYIDFYVSLAFDNQEPMLVDYKAYFEKLAKANYKESGVDYIRPISSIAAVVRNIEIFIPINGVVDFDKEKSRLNKLIALLETEMNKCKQKLRNPDFLKNAKPVIIEREINKYEDMKKQHDLISNQIKNIEFVVDSNS